MKLTDDAKRVMEVVPFIGFPAGSNMWPMVWLTFDESGTNPIDGEVIDGLLREGLLEAAPLATPVLTDRSPDIESIPDCECTHQITVSEAGRRALEGQP